MNMQQQLIAILPMIAVFAIFYFMMLRPQRKREKERVSMLGNLKRGDKVITIGGLHGSIIDINDQRVTLKVNDNNRLTFERSSVNQVVTQEKKKEEEDED
jgi:preprotein translocase subunit YajC